MPSDVCTVCNKPGWPDCGHLEGFPDVDLPGQPADFARGTNELRDDEEKAIAEFEEANPMYRKRGRPKLPPDMKRREKLVIALTGPELKDMIHTAADAENGPFKVQDWARDILISASKKKNQ